MTQKIIFFDIDGTLYDHDKKLPASTKKALLQLQEKGHEVAIATGRAPFMFEDLLEELGIETFVSYNGQYVVFKGEPIYRNALDSEALLRLATLAEERKHPIVYMDHEDMKTNTLDHEHILAGIQSLKISHFPAHDPAFHEGRDSISHYYFAKIPKTKNTKNNFPNSISFAGILSRSISFPPAVQKLKVFKKSSTNSALPLRIFTHLATA